MHPRGLIAALAVALTVTACTTGSGFEADAAPIPAVAPAKPPQVTVAQTVATGLTSPWGLAFLPDGTALVSERELAVEAGMDDFLTKPIDADRLRDTLARWARRPRPQPTTASE